MRRKKLTYYLYVLLLLLFSSTSVFANNSEPPLPKPNDVIPPGLLIDGGISFLLIAGAVLGIYASKKKLKD